MNYSEVIVQYGDGSKPRGKKVTLQFSGIGGGASKPAYTDSSGRALVEHASTGSATVYVDGKNHGTFQAPGKTAVFLS